MTTLTVNLDQFRLAGSQRISDFLYSCEDLSYCDRISDITKIVLNRIFHYCRTGIWIDETSCLRFCQANAIKDLKAIQRTFNRSVAVQFPAFQANESKARTVCAEVDEKWLFVKRSCQDPKTVGALFPSSPFLSRAIIKNIPPVDPDDMRPRRVLEVGAGTGPFTDYIVANLKPADHLDIVEIEPEFCEILKSKFGHLKNVSIHQQSILDFNADKYDVLVTGLPLNAFKSDFVRKVFDKYVSLTKDNGHISYFEYMGLPTIGRFFMGGEEGRDFDKIMALKADFTRRYGEGQDEIWFNLMPARVQHWKVPPS